VLAPETRNQIYDYLLDDMRREGTRDSYLRDPARLAAEAVPTRLSPRDHMRYHRVKQASHHFNAEFGPLLNDREYNIIHLIDLYTYFNHVRPPAIFVPGSQIQTLYVNATLPPTTKLDMLPLIRIFQNHPQLNFQFIYNASEGERENSFGSVLQALQSTYPSWQALTAFVKHSELPICFEDRYERLKLIVPPVADPLVKDVGT
jgi:hypothetical protein